MERYSLPLSFFSRTIILPLLLITLIVNYSSVSYAQDTTSVAVQEQNIVSPVKHSAHKATIYSLALPGLGQAYNKKYWKIPVIYAGFGVLVYNISINNSEVKKFTAAYRYRMNNDSTLPVNEYVTRYPDVNDLLRGRDFYRRRVELSVIFTAAWYLLNVVDAAVDAHFFDYDVSENLSLNIQPIIMRTPEHPIGTGGIRLCMNF